MRSFLTNILLTFVWVVLTGEFIYQNFILGFAMSFFVLWISTGYGKSSRYFPRLISAFGLIFYFIRELLKANVLVTYDIITPKFKMQPAIIAVPLSVESDLEITLLANLITLTPGTLSIDVSDDKKIIYVHTMYLVTPEKFIEQIKSGLERRLLEVLR
ncbi:MAG: Na+/H+ antiporter subunit E [Bacteroidetes bacterium]|nr:Na+/H+ antiporter subunit E [Bacteroidota bacterium]HET6244488.1 Na+/H+ antiporter subunit E [Bacteroidia bacterium]